jgi:hypothetical protein
MAYFTKTEAKLAAQNKVRILAKSSKTILDSVSIESIHESIQKFEFSCRIPLKMQIWFSA